MEDVPRPRVLFEAVPDTELLDELIAFAPTHGVFGADVERIHATDWDLVVSFHHNPEEPSGVHVLSFGGTKFGQMHANGLWLSPRRDMTLDARAVTVPDTLPTRLRSLTERTVVDRDPGPGRTGLQGLPTGEGRVDLAVAGAERHPWAAMFLRKGKTIWALPEETTNHVEWLVAVLQVLHELEPERFPGTPDWQRQASWGTPMMRAELTELDTVTGDRTSALKAFEVREAGARSRLDLAVAEASTGAQQVLTADGPELEAAVQQLLGDLGFTVQHMDEHHASHSGGRLEDLRASAPDRTWTCLIEVKGYTGGAKVRDVGRITGRPSVAYAARENKPPDSVWHVVNAWRETDPDTREVAVPQAHDLAVLTDAGGCLIDTRDLFLAWRDVQEGAAGASDVRTSLQSAVTRWTWAPRAEGEGDVM